MRKPLHFPLLLAFFVFQSESFAESNCPSYFDPLNVRVGSKTQSKFTDIQVQAVVDYYQELHKVFNEHFESPEVLDLEINRTWRAIRAYFPEHIVPRIHITFSKRPSELNQQQPDTASKLLMGHEWGHVLFDKNFKGPKIKIWRNEELQRNYLKKHSQAKSNKDRTTLENLDRDWENLRKTLSPWEREVLEKDYLNRTSLPYEELFADILGMTFLSPQDFAKADYRKYVDSFTTNIPVEAWKHKDEHYLLDPVRSWLWKEKLSMLESQNDRILYTRKVFEVINQELMIIFNNKEMLRSFSKRTPGSIQEMNSRLIRALSKN